VLYLDAGSIYVYCCNGRWACATIGGLRRLDIFGPEVKDEWTHLAVTLDHDLLRFYVNGKEVVSPDGPIRRLSDQGRGAFQGKMDFLYGTANPGWQFFFRGGLKGLKYYSRCFTPEEVAAKSREQW